MGMVVRTNMAALGANNSLAQASKAQQNGMQKLYTGFKINAAKDDASGLAISEKMKNQIKALDTAKDNCEDGANMIQTAEGYMKETHDILTRMTELAEKSANGLLKDEDRGALQNEMDQLCGEIDRMATTANFNGVKLLDGSLGSSDAVKLTISGKEIKYTAPSKNVTHTGNNGYDIDVSSFSNLKPGNYTTDANGTKILDSNGAEMDVTFNANQLKFRAGDTITFSATDGKTGTSTANGATINELTDTALKGATYTFDGTNWNSNDPGITKSINPVINSADDKKNLSFTISEGINLQIGESSTAADRLEVKINSFHTDSLFGGLNGFVNKTNDVSDDAASAMVKTNNGNDASTYKNAVTIDIKDKDSASAAADAIRQISNYVSDERGKLGAQQNRLEHTVNNLATASENTTAAKSRILDTDMAKEMMEYTSKNVIAQAAQSMLAQANSQPQNVLSLLQ